MSFIRTAQDTLNFSLSSSSFKRISVITFSCSSRMLVDIRTDSAPIVVEPPSSSSIQGVASSSLSYLKTLRILVVAILRTTFGCADGQGVEIAYVSHFGFHINWVSSGPKLEISYMMATRSLRPQLWTTTSFFRSCIRRPQRRSLIPAPKTNTGPLMSRRADRDLPNVQSSAWIWIKTLPIFIVVMIGSALALINYERSCSSIVSSTLYALRHNETGRKELGDEIYFRDKFPWIRGEMNQRFGRIDISYGVKGTNSKGLMRFKAERKTRMGMVSASAFKMSLLALGNSSATLAADSLTHSHLAV